MSARRSPRPVSLIGEVASTQRHVVVVFNPAAGRGRAVAEAAAIRKQLSRELVSFDWHETEGPGHAAEIVRPIRQSDADRILLVGGDGTLSDLLPGLVGRDDAPPLAIIPAGTGNDAARTLGTFDLSVGDSIRVAMERQKVALDVGRIGDRLFLNGFGAGIDGAVAARSQSIRFLRGMAPYLVAAALTIPRWKPFGFEVELDGEKLSGPGTLVAFSNSRTCGGGIKLTPRANPRDGLLDACIVGGKGAFQLLTQLPRAVAGTHVDDPSVTYRQIRRAHIRFDRPLTAHVDGNLIHGLTEARLEVLPGALVAVSR